MDYYAKRLATASSDRTIKIFEGIETAPAKQIAEIRGWVFLFEKAFFIFSNEDQGMKVLSGKLLGLTQNTSHFLPPALMIEKFVFGKKPTRMYGKKFTNTTNINRQVDYHFLR